MKRQEGRLHERRRVIRLIFVYVRLVVVAAIMLYPILWAIATSFKSIGEYRINPVSLWPQNPTLENFREAWERGDLQRYITNSIIIAIPSVLVGLVVMIMGGYALAILRFKYRYVIYLFIVLGLAIPLELIIVPLFMQVRAWGMYNTFWGVILPFIGWQVPFGILLLRNYFLDFPSELLDAARLDGCTEINVLWKVLVPNMMPGISALITFLFLFSWNMFLLPIVMITQFSKRTITTGLSNFVGQYESTVPWMMAGAIIVSIPIIFVYILLQRHFVQGLTSGALRQ